ncbi:hypothetical protein NQ318_016253 [Aromia moschata]|uniref:Uncharacterized protein n=1 Tax=Aromia moschata TaxID=1265417 RepID=A0AAV8XZX9_9CUCU|nr:hypothetical protein NQ318_016253 [Aromia moschata]
MLGPYFIDGNLNDLEYSSSNRSAYCQLVSAESGNPTAGNNRRNCESALLTRFDQGILGFSGTLIPNLKSVNLYHIKFKISSFATLNCYREILSILKISGYLPLAGNGLNILSHVQKSIFFNFPPLQMDDGSPVEGFKF